MSQNQLDASTDTGIDSSTAGRRVRGLSREIFFAIALTAAAIASIAGVANRTQSSVNMASGTPDTTTAKSSKSE